MATIVPPELWMGARYLLWRRLGPDHSTAVEIRQKLTTLSYKTVMRARARLGLVEAA